MLRNEFSVVLLLIPLMIAGNSYAGGRVGVPKTGEITCYDSSGNPIACTGTGQDGALQKGVAWPSPRFTDNGNGTVTDNMTNLIWLKNANCTDTIGGIAKGSNLTWANALTWSNNLASSSCGLTDGSVAGDWRLPSDTELKSLVDASKSSPPLPTGHPFLNVQSFAYWSATTYAPNTTDAWYVYMGDGFVSYSSKANSSYVWPVRGGQ